MKKPFTTSKRAGVAGTLALLVLGSGRAGAELSFPDVPLLISNSVPPNLVLMLDNSGSMNAIAPVAPYDPAAAQSACPAANLVPTNRQVELYVGNSPSGEPRIALSFVVEPGGESDTDQGGSPAELVDAVFAQGVGAGQLCFDPAANIRYSARLDLSRNVATDIVDGVEYRIPRTYEPASYSGHFLNWYFNPDNTDKTWNSGELLKPLGDDALVRTRAQIARTAAIELVGTLDQRLRVGLASYNSGDGGTLNVGVAHLSPTHRANLTAGLNALQFTGPTPLAETLSGIGRYLTQGYDSGGLLSLHPGQPNQSAQSVARVLPRTLRNSERFSEPPIARETSCQQSFAALLTDGLPNGDRNEEGNIGESLLDYDGDCSGANAANCLPSPHYDRKPGRRYESQGSDYLDDIAQALFEIDLRPDFPNESLSGVQFKNNLVTHMIGFADDDVVNDPLILDTAIKGGGRFFAARDAAELRTAFDSIVSEVLDRSGGFSAVALTTTILNESTRVFQSRFNSVDWSGDLSSLPVSTGSVGGSCPLVPLGSVCAVEWSAAAQLDTLSPGSRVILTQRASNGAGIPFRWANLDASQRALLDIHFNPVTRTGSVDSRGEERLDYIRGDRALESAGNFRVRGTLLGDIVNSDPVFVGTPSQAYPFPGYAAFRVARAARERMVYVGANDGMLHGFRVSDGRELLAYVPNALFGRTDEPKLARLTANPYIHTWGVDGSPIVGDIQIGSAGAAADWRSYLVGALEYGGQGLFALDVTDPSSFSESNASDIVKWEFTDANSGVEGRDLGRTFSEPFIVKMKNGRWAAIIGNGYNNTEADGNASSTGQAALFIIFMDGPGADGVWNAGTEYIKLTVPGGSATAPNGMATPAPVDIDGDSLIDYVYAGDLLGNLWQFNVNSTDSSSWRVGYGAQPLFAAGAGQPITATPEVGLNLLTADDPDDVIVYFGTGQFIANGDNTPDGQQDQSFYGIFANPISSPGPPVAETGAITAVTRGDLLEQSIVQETEVNGNQVRITSSQTLDLTVHKGWFIDLRTPGSGNQGERQVTRPVLRNGRIVFTTLKPSQEPCDFGGGGFLMEIEAQTGSRPTRPALDITNDITVDEEDLLDGVNTGAGVADDVVVSGIGAETGILSRPAVLAIPPNLEIKIVGTSGGTVETFGEAVNTRTGRITWREINP
ncbi:MAG: pilus assembly protein [Panacagrimonas sp.]